MPKVSEGSAPTAPSSLYSKAGMDGLKGSPKTQISRPDVVGSLLVKAAKQAVRGWHDISSSQFSRRSQEVSQLLCCHQHFNSNA